MADRYGVEAVGAEESSACSCCGRAVYEGTGWLVRDDEELACYTYRWSDGHDIAFSLAVAGTVGEHMRPGFVSVSCRRRGSDLSYSVVEPQDSHWGESEDFGPVLSRESALDPEGLYPDLWQLVDKIVALEDRLSNRILSSGHVESDT